ncbi:T9SS type A sorting domain-containing protein [Flavobacterium sp.]|uniref:Ig-like domain-containing protein n=1 Tax=Flavobacterium sp. TaxID=239 RepID=UPI0026182BCA|nr:T9SS type A sorting domain-containing protein [Flavobacterium sp.]
MGSTLRLLFYSFMIFAAFSFSSYAQLNFTQNFENPTPQWEGLGFSRTLQEPCDGTGSLRASVFSFPDIFTLSAESVSPTMGASDGTPATLQFNYRLVNWASGPPYDSAVQNSTSWGSLTFEYATSSTGPWTEIVNITPENHVESNNCSSFNATFTPPVAAQIYLRIYADPTTTFPDGVDYYVYIDNLSVSQLQLDYVNLQWPPTMELSVGETGTVYAQAYEDGVTPGAGPGAGVTAWIGISEEDTDPATWDTWIPATYNTAVTGNNDEFMGDIGAGLEPGTYYYASRFQLQDGPYTYGGYTPTGGGYWDGTTNVSGVLTVTCDTEAPTALAEQQFCAGATVAGLSADGDTIVWYTTETGGEPLEEETVLANGTYYAAQIPEGGCESQSRTAVTVTVVTIDTPTVSVVQPTCAVNSGSITINTPTGAGLVYSINGADFQASNVFSGLEGGTYMVYVENELGCTSEPFTVVLEPAESVEAPVADAQQTVCNGSALEELMAEGDNVVWYADETGGEPLDIETMLTDGTTYYAAAVEGECESERTAVTVTLNVVPAPTGEAIQEFDGPATLTFEDIEIDATGELNWYASEEDAMNSDNELDSDYEITETQTLYVTQEIDGCESAPFAVTIEVVLSTESFDSAAFRYHPNPVKDVLTLNYSNAIENVVVYNLLGQSVLERSGSSNAMQLDMAQLSAGTYIVKVTSQGAVKTIKVAKQ